MTAPAGTQYPRIRSSHRATASSEAITVTTTPATAVGDFLVAIYAFDWGDVSDFGAPTGTPGAWSYVAVGDRGTNGAHVKGYTRRVTTPGAQRVTLPGLNNDDIALVVLVFDGATVDASSFTDGWRGSSGAASRNHVAQEVGTSGPAPFYIAAFATADSATNGKPIANYTPPTGMVSALRQGATPIAADTTSSSEWISLGVFVQNLPAVGTTGARTAVSSVSRPFAAFGLGIRGIRLAVTLYLDGGGPVAQRITVQPGEIAMTGMTYDGDRIAARITVEPGEITHEVDSAPIAVTSRVPADIALERVLADHLPPRLRVRPIDSVLDSTVGQAVRVRWTVQGGELTWRAVTPMTEERPRITTRPRKRVRYLAQEVLSRAWRSGDVELGGDHITTRINGATSIGGKIDAKELKALGINEADLYIHAEVDGSIRGSAMLTLDDFSWGGPAIEIDAKGVSNYLHGIRYEDDWTLRGSTGIVGVSLDPLDVVRHLWRYAQTPADGRLGVVVSNDTSTVRIGEVENKTVTAVDASAGTTGGTTSASTGTTTKTPSTTAANTTNTAATGAAPTSGDGTEQTKGPWLLKWWEDTDLGKSIDDLVKAAPFDFVEAPYWNADRTDVVQFIQLGWPRVGRDRSGDDIVFADLENLTKALTPVEHDDIFAQYITVLGKGEGTARIRGRYGRPVPGRVRKTAMVEKKDCSTTAMADAFARAEWPARQGYLSFDEAHLKVSHRNAPYGSYRVGDDVPMRAKIDGVGPVLLRHRVMEETLSPSAGTLVVKTQRSDTFTYGSSAGAP